MGKNGAGKTTLLQDGRGRCSRPTPAQVRLGASLKMGYFAQQALDLLDPDLTRLGADAGATSRTRAIGVLRNLLGAFQFSGDDVDKKIRALSGGEKSRLVMARMLSTRRTSWCSTSRPTTSTSRPRRCWSRRSQDFEGTMLFVSHDRTFLRGLSNRVLELGGESGTEPEPHLYPGSYVEYVAADRPRSAGRAQRGVRS